MQEDSPRQRDNRDDDYPFAVERPITEKEIETLKRIDPETAAELYLELKYDEEKCRDQ